MTQQKSVIELARSLPLRCPRPPGGEEKVHVDTMLAQLRADWLLALPVPIALGGPGLGIADAARVTFHLARASGSLGLLYAMHMSQMFSLARHGRGAHLEALQRRCAAEQLLIASGTSEKGVGGDIFGSLCEIEGEGDALSVSKETPNISYLDHADLVLVSAVSVSGKRRRQVLVAADVAMMELRPGREAGFLGMRGMLNRSYGFTARFPRTAIFDEPYPAIARATMTPTIHILWGALWSGIAADALARARRFVAEEVEEGEVATVLRVELTRLADRHHAMNALIRDAIAEYEQPAETTVSLGATARVKRLKLLASDMLVEICIGATKLIGLRAYALGGPYSLAAHLRDALSAPIMVSNYRLAIGNAGIERFVEEEL